MRAVLQRVSRAQVTVESRVTGSIASGLMILLGVGLPDTTAVATSMAEKCANLRMFEDEQGKMNRSVMEINGEVLVVSQFTLAASTRKGNRPSFDNAEAPEQAKRMYDLFVNRLRDIGAPVQTGTFAAMMRVVLVNDGPVTIALDSRED